MEAIARSAIVIVLEANLQMSQMLVADVLKEEEMVLL